MNCLIVGSIALKYHIPEIYREPADIDLIVDSQETKDYILKNKKKVDEVMSFLGVDFNKYKINFLPIEDESNHLIFKLLKKTDDKFLNINVASLSILKICKLASIPWNLQKHNLDLKFLDNVVLNSQENEIYQKRLRETESRVLKQNLDFFTENVPRYIKHDQLHLYVSKNPAYKLILEDNHAYKGNKDKFEKLSLDHQFLVVAEEVLVFSLERWLIPEFMQNSLSIAKLCDKFVSDFSTSGPMHHWTLKFMQNGGVKRNPAWISRWLLENYVYFVNRMSTWWEESFNDLPEEFWLELLDKKNEKTIL